MTDKVFNTIRRFFSRGSMKMRILDKSKGKLKQNKEGMNFLEMVDKT